MTILEEDKKQSSLNIPEERWRKEKLEAQQPDFSGEVIWASEEGIAIQINRITTLLERKAEAQKDLPAAAYDGHDIQESEAHKALMVELGHNLPQQTIAIRREQAKTLPFQEARWFRECDPRLITLGTRITLQASDSPESETVDLLGPLEASVNKRSVQAISYVSPLGRALFGRKKGDLIAIRDVSFKIIETEQIIPFIK